MLSGDSNIHNNFLNSSPCNPEFRKKLKKKTKTKKKKNNAWQYGEAGSENGQNTDG